MHKIFSSLKGFRNFKLKGYGCDDQYDDGKEGYVLSYISGDGSTYGYGDWCGNGCGDSSSYNWGCGYGFSNGDGLYILKSLSIGKEDA